MLKESKILSEIMYYVGCDEDTASKIFGGAWRFGGDNYSAFIDYKLDLIICMNGKRIYEISMKRVDK